MVEIEEERLGFGMTSFKNLISFTFIKEKRTEGKKDKLRNAKIKTKIYILL